MCYLTRNSVNMDGIINLDNESKIMDTNTYLYGYFLHVNRFFCNWELKKSN